MLSGLPTAAALRREIKVHRLALAATGGVPAGQPAGQPTASAPPFLRYLYPKGLVAFWSADGHRRDSVGKSHGAGEVAYTADRHGNPKGAFLFGTKTGAVMDFDANSPGTVTAEMWDGTELRGRLAEGILGFTIAPGGPTLGIQVPQLASISRKEALPPPQIAQRIEALIARLGAESYNDREAAARALSAMGPRIAPVLRKHLKDPDPEIRQRIEDILEKLNPKPAPRPPAVEDHRRRMPVLILD